MLGVSAAHLLLSFVKVSCWQLYIAPGADVTRPGEVRVETEPGEPVLGAEHLPPWLPSPVPDCSPRHRSGNTGALLPPQFENFFFHKTGAENQLYEAVGAGAHGVEIQ